MFFPHYSQKFNVIFCLNGKIASTLFKEWLIRIHQVCEQPDTDYLIQQKDLDDINWDRALIHRLAGAGCYQISKDELHHLQDKCRTKVILVVRNPWHRLLSFYYYWVVDQQANQEGFTINNTFAEVVRELESRPARDAHVIPQFENLEDINFDCQIEMEHLAQQLQHYLEQNNLILDQIPISYHPINFFLKRSNCINYTEHTLTDCQDIFQKNPADLTGRELKQYQIKPKPGVMYDQELTQMVQHIYASDFLRLRYTEV